MIQNLITIIISVITLFLSAYLAYYFGIQSTRAKEKDEKKKKLNKLLYHLLIVRKAASEKLNFKKRLESINELQIQYMRENLGISESEISNREQTEILEKQFELISSTLFEDLKLDSEKSKNSIEIILQEYIEIDPLFSLTLKNYDKKLKATFIEKMITEYSHENEAKIVKQYIVPQLESKMITEIDEVLHSITSKLDSKIQREVQELLIKNDTFEVDMNDFKEYLDNTLLPIKNTIENQ
jgi:hypothetical protein